LVRPTVKFSQHNFNLPVDIRPRQTLAAEITRPRDSHHLLTVHPTRTRTGDRGADSGTKPGSTGANP
jgi:hypothetical protein